LLKLLLQVSISGGKLFIALSQLLGFQGVEDLSVVNSGDESIGDGVDGFIEVHLSGESIKSSLKREWQVLGSNSGLDKLEGNRQWRRVRWGLVR
jgi:hypothetical protein